MNSIRRHLTIRLVAVTLLLAAAAGASLFAFVRSRLMGEFDRSLLAEARAISGAVLWESSGRLEFDYSAASAPDGGRTTYFEIRRSDGSVFQRSTSLRGRNLPSVTAVSGGPQFMDVQLFRKRPGRAVTFRFTPHPDQEDDPGGKAAQAGTSGPAPELTVVLAGDRAGLDGTLRLLGWSLLLAAVGLSVGTALAVTWTVRRGLRPLERVAAEADAIRADSLHHRFSTHGLPAELRPICGRLNELLARLQEAFERERRFTADVAHELRTPIAELRSLAEVALRWPQDASPTQNYRDVLDVARHMESVVAALLDIARCESGIRQAGAETIDVCEIVKEAWRPHESLAITRGLDVCWDLPAAATVRSDRPMLLGMIGNLLSNAVTYTPSGGRIECRVRHAPGGVEVAIGNTCDTLGADDLAHLFEPFWRKDAARTGGVHAGLGLPLVAAYASTLGASLHVELARAEDEFRIQLAVPTASRDKGASDNSPPLSEPLTSSVLQP